MDVYMYKADLYSAAGVAAVLGVTGEVEAGLGALAAARGIDRADESSFDSDDFPKGPYPDGGGEADYPVHCAATGEFMDNPLTEDGSAYVKQAFRAFKADGRGDAETLSTWADAYPNEYTEAVEEAQRDGLIAPGVELVPAA